jgi:hypothetical protein
MAHRITPTESGGWGVDMLRFTTTDFNITDLSAAPWQIKGGQKVNEPIASWGKYQSATGEALSGTGYFLNPTESGLPFTAELKHPNNGKDASLLVQVNPSTFAHPYMLTTDCEPALDAVDKGLKSIGIHSDIYGSKLTRIDLTKQSELDVDIRGLHPVFNMLQGKRMKQKHYEDGFEVKNGRRAGVFYDKTLQMNTVKGFTGDIPSRLIRLEARFHQSKTIGSMKSGVGVGTVQDLLNAKNQHLLRAYNRFVRDDVFRANQASQITFDFDKGERGLRQCIEAARMEGKSHSAGWTLYLTTMGASEVLIQFNGDIDFIKRVLMDEGFSRRHCDRIGHQIREAVQRKGFMERNSGIEGDFISRNYTLLHDTFAA